MYTLFLTEKGINVILVLNYARSFLLCRVFGYSDILLINFVGYINNREMTWHQKSTIQISAKLDITSYPLHELIRNNVTKNLISNVVEAVLEAMALQQDAETTLLMGVIPLTVMVIYYNESYRLVFRC